jgi:4-amino-4-deoxy-L-arabinose transferase-like glycosyltransferase
MSTATPQSARPAVVKEYNLGAPFLSGGIDQFRLGWKAAAVVVLFGATLLLPNLDGGTRSLSYHEVLFAQPAREMLATGNFILPRFAGIPSTHKPPGAHWAIAAVMFLAGSEAEQLVRIPSALAGVVAAVILAALAARWFGRQVGLVSGLALLTSYYACQLGRLAECDMLLVAAVTGAMSCYACVHVESPSGRVNARWMPWLFYACVTCAFFFKGLIGPAFILSGCIAYSLWSQGFRGMKFFFDPLGLGVFAVCALGWFIAAYAQYPTILSDQLLHHFARFQGRMGGGKDPFYYLYSIPLIVLPWAPLILSGVVLGLRQGLYTQPFWRFVACWVIPGTVLLSLSTFKTKHYAAPLMPPLAIIGALSLLAYLRSLQRQSGRKQFMFATAGILACATGAVIVQMLQRSSEEKYIISGLLLLAAAGVVATTFLLHCGKLRSGLSAVFATAWLAIFTTLGWIMPHHDSYRSQTELARRINAVVPEGKPLYLLHLPADGEHQVAYYLRQPFLRIDDPQNFAAALSKDCGERYVVAPVSVVENLRRLGTLDELDTHPARRKQPESERLVFGKLIPTATAGEKTRVR